METRASALESNAKRSQAQTELLILEEYIALQRHRIAALLGAGPDRGLSIDPPAIKLSNKIGLPDNIAADLIGRRPDLVAARLQAQAFESRIEQKRADFYPNVNLAGFIGLQSLGLSRLTQGGSVIGAFGPAISLPIFTGGRLQGELKSAQAAYDESIATYNLTLTYALKNVADALVSLKALNGQLEQAELGLEAAKEALKLVLNRYQGGLSNYLDVLIAEDIMLSSLRMVTELSARRFTLDVNLIRALGGGYEQVNLPTLRIKKS